jgi:hypothetical protein
MQASRPGWAPGGRCPATTRRLADQRGEGRRVLDRWTQDDRNAILDVIRADLTISEQHEIASLADEDFDRFVGRLFTIVQDKFSGGEESQPV